MGMSILDYVLVPLGLGLMVAYHVWLLYMVMRHPTKTVIGINSINRRAWVHTMMEDPSKNGILAVQTLRNNIMSSTLLASTAIMLCSLVAMLMTQSSSSSSLTLIIDQKHFSLKSFFILSCFLVAFLMNIQSVRFYNHASILINARRSSLLTPEYVADAVNRASYFWSIGLRAFYFSFPLFLWIFGAIPMFLCCVALVCMLRLLDVMFHGMASPEEEGEEINEFVGNGRGGRVLSLCQIPN